MSNFCGIISKKKTTSKSHHRWINPTVNLSNFLNTFSDLDKITNILYHALEDFTQLFTEIANTIKRNDSQFRCNIEKLNTIESIMHDLNHLQREVEALLDVVCVAMGHLERHIKVLEEKPSYPLQMKLSCDNHREMMYKSLEGVVTHLRSNKEFLSEINKEVEELNENQPIGFPSSLINLLHLHMKILEDVEKNIAVMMRTGEENQSKLENIEFLRAQKRQ